MRILQICKKFPFPLKDGESIAINGLSKALVENGCEVTLLAMNTTRHYFDGKEIPPALGHYKKVHSTLVDNRIRLKDAFLNLFSQESYHVARFVSHEFNNTLIRLLKKEEFDVVQLETLYLAPYIPTIRRFSNAKIAMRAHNVEHEIWERIAGNTAFFPKRWYLKYLSKKLEQFEVAQLNQYDILIGITKRDMDIFNNLGFKNTSVVTPIGLDVNQYKPDYSSLADPLSISFIGSLDWMPNQEGLYWFLNNVWKKCHNRFPEVHLHIAGRNTPPGMLNMNVPNVHVYGEVPNAADFINRHAVMLVPLLSGSGMRAKILEGMALGKVVITTSLGLEGIPASHKKEVLIADSPQAFINCLQYCRKYPDRLKETGMNARAFIKRNFDNHHAIRNLLNTYKSQALEVI